MLFANELLDALPAHQVVMRKDGLREVYVAVARDAATLRTVEGPPSTPALAAYLARLGIALEPGWRAEINLRALRVDSRRGPTPDARIHHPHRLRPRGARAVFGDPRQRHADDVRAAHDGRARVARPTRRPWLDDPGDQDITAHVDFTSVRAAAEAEGLTTLGFLDQTYFLLGLLMRRESSAGSVPRAI